MENLHGETNTNWYYENRPMNGHFYNDSILKLVNGYSEYGKEALKRTMLEHEAVFREQVFELHRVYRIQKDIMDELKTKEFNRFALSVDAPRSNLFSSQMSSTVTENAWQVPHLTIGTTNYHETSAAISNEMRPPLDMPTIIGMRSRQIPSMKEDSQKDEESSDSKLTKFPCKTFDLQFPADVYVDNEDAETAENENAINSSFGSSNPLNTNTDTEPENDVKLTLRLGDIPCPGKDICQSDSDPNNDMLIHRLADLNEPIMDIHEGVGSDATQFNSVRTHHEGIQGHQFLSTENDQYKDFLIGTHTNEGTLYGKFDAYKEETRKEWLLFHNGIGQSRSDVNAFRQGLCNEKLPMPSKPMPLMYTSHGIALPDQRKTEAWFIDEPSNTTEIRGRNHHLPSPSYSGLTGPRMLSPFSVDPHPDYSNASLTMSTWSRSLKATTHSPIKDNHSSALNGQNMSLNAGIHNLNNSFGEWPYDGGFWSNATSGSNHVNKSAYGISTGHVAKLNNLRHANEKPAPDASLNQTLANRIQECLTAHQNVGRNREESPRELALFGTKLVCSGSESGFMLSSPQLLSRSMAAVPEINKKQDKGKSPASWILPDFLASLKFNESTIQKDAMHDNDQNLKFSISDLIQQNPTNNTSSSTKQIHVVDLIGGNDVVNNNKGWHLIDLNSAVSCIDTPESLKTAPNDEAGISSPLSVPSIAGKIVSDIDLEAPIASLAESNINSHEAIQINHLAAQQSFAKIAADSLIAMSLDKGNWRNNSTPPLNPPTCDPLHWFADFVSSARVTKEGGCSSGQYSDSDGLDHFEHMTLKLKELEPDKYRCRPMELKNQDDEGTSNTYLVLTKPRRGWGRKRKQRRDFQNDILPGLVSLSRCEVNADLEALGAPTRTSGRSLKASVARRDASSDVYPPRGRGRGRGRSSPVTIPDIGLSPIPTQLTLAEPEPEPEHGQRSIQRRGTTRRCRRQKILSGNASALLT